MITLYYTGASAFQAVQNVPEMSLGGYISSSLIPNGRLNNLFSDESYDSNQNGSVACRAIALLSDSPITDLIIGSDIDPTIANFSMQIAAVQLIQPASQKMEAILDEADLPYVANFGTIDKNTNQSIGSIAANTLIGLWIKRTVNSTAALSCSQLSLLTPSNSNIQKSFQLIFNF